MKLLIRKTIKYSLILSFTFLFFLIGFVFYLRSDFNDAIPKEQLEEIYSYIENAEPVTEEFYEAANYVKRHRSIFPYIAHDLYTINDSYAEKGSCPSYWLSRLLNVRQLGKTRGELKEYKSIWGLTLKLEKNFSQKQCYSALMGMYDFNYGAKGIRNASKKYFQKELEELTQRENRILALMAINPTLYNPLRFSDKIEQKLKELEQSKKNK